MFSKRLSAVLFASLLAAPPVLSQSVFVVDGEAWSRPRSAETLLELASLREAVAALREDDEHRLAIRHPRGEQGEFWGAELREWLVALGIPSARVDVEADAAVHDRVDLVILR